MATPSLFPALCVLSLCIASLAGCVSSPEAAVNPAPGFSSCDAEHDLIEQAFADAAGCASDMDCTSMRLGGHAIEFGCQKPVNKAFDQDAMYRRIEAYLKNCTRAIDDCGFTDKASCKAGRCVLSEG